MRKRLTDNEPSWLFDCHRVSGPQHFSELKIRRRQDSTTADLVEGVWDEVAVAMARKIALRKLARRRVVVAPFPVEV